jgi:hypothetical protein
LVTVDLEKSQVSRALLTPSRHCCQPAERAEFRVLNGASGNFVAAAIEFRAHLVIVHTVAWTPTMAPPKSAEAN